MKDIVLGVQEHPVDDGSWLLVDIVRMKVVGVVFDKELAAKISASYNAALGEELQEQE